MNEQAIENGIRDAGRRDELVKTAAQTLVSLPDDVVMGIACSSPRNFVGTVRKTYRREGFSFTDSDLRRIHEIVRMLVAKKISAGGLAVNKG